jgi:hypothetical protein
MESQEIIKGKDGLDAEHTRKGEGMRTFNVIGGECFCHSIDVISYHSIRTQQL